MGIFLSCLNINYYMYTLLLNPFNNQKSQRVAVVHKTKYTYLYAFLVLMWTGFKKNLLTSCNCQLGVISSNFHIQIRVVSCAPVRSSIKIILRTSISKVKIA